MKKEDWNLEYSGFPILQTYHSLIFEKSAFEIGLMINTKKRIHREHLIPEKRTFRILDKYNNYIVLLRNPIDSYDNYCRATKNLEQKELLKELELFNFKYRQYLKNKKNILLIEYEDLILDYNKTMLKIKKYWNIKGNIIPLLKENYTGVGYEKLTRDNDSK